MRQSSTGSNALSTQNAERARCSDFDYFWYASSPTAAVRNNASAKFVAHSEGEMS